MAKEAKGVGRVEAITWPRTALKARERAVTVGDGQELKEKDGRPMGSRGIVGIAVEKATRKDSARNPRGPKVRERELICWKEKGKRCR